VKNKKTDNEVHQIQRHYNQSETLQKSKIIHRPQPRKRIFSSKENVQL